MKKALLSGLIILLAACVVILPGCKKDKNSLTTFVPADNTKKDTLRLFNLLPDLAADYSKNIGYLVYLNDSLVYYGGTDTYQGFTYGVAPAVLIPAGGGTFSLKVTKYEFADQYNKKPQPPGKNPDAAAVVLQKTITVPAHSGYSNMVFYDDNGKPSAQFIPLTASDPGAPAPGKFKVRVVNYGYPMTQIYGTPHPDNSAGQKYALQMQYADSTVVTGNANLAFGSVGQYSEIPYGTHKFLIYNNTTKKYINNSGPLDDVLNTFNLSPLTDYQTSNYLFPCLGPGDQVGLADHSTMHRGNIGSYPFAAGGCYTILVIGDGYAVTLDRRYGAGQLDNFGQVQVVNANPNQPDMAVKVAYDGGQKDVPSLHFGDYTTPQIVPAGNVTLTFTSAGKTLYTYNGQVSRLANISFYYYSELNGLPALLPVSNTISSNDFVKGDPSYGIPAKLQLANVGEFNLSPDAGKIFFTLQSVNSGGQEVNMGYYAVNDQEVPYKFLGSNSRMSYDTFIPPTKFNARLSAARKDSLATKLVGSLSPPFKTLPAPGTYTLVAAGLLNTNDPAKKIRLIMVKHSNFISKATN
ncbi:DUF4397 domain-containing protein [Mucilaginibacter paludis]|uniref:DUF4397 domain-containing protein n=1 Tax=Mucilaginibacter paludis DSM 18603 TaxID=714943 RepID=H1YGW3_9SPHI|nr:DUF4397 domain-containing protein [Mucilaginibacter paludis]EHQ26392.1 hypothetical protein Mucpa_2259 [Mucilaginibacter paludis DSM 18603]